MEKKQHTAHKIKRGRLPLSFVSPSRLVLVLTLIFSFSSFQTMGVALRARARVQINLAVSQVVDIKQVATFPDIVFPIMWFEDVSKRHVSLGFFPVQTSDFNPFFKTLSGHRWSSRRSYKSSQSCHESATNRQSSHLLQFVRRRCSPPYFKFNMHH